MAKTLEKLALPFLIGASAIALYAGAQSIGKERSAEIGYQLMEKKDPSGLFGPAVLGAVLASVVGGAYVLMKDDRK